MHGVISVKYSAWDKKVKIVALFLLSILLINTSIDFYKKIGKGGTTTDLPHGKGTKTTLNDGTVIVHRLITGTKGSPAVEITVSGTAKIKNQKIHFVLKEE